MNESAGVNVDAASGKFDWRPSGNSGVELGVGWVGQRRERGHDESAPIASLAGYIDVNAQTRLRADISRRVRAPSVAQLYDPSSGNPDLQMERATTAEAGVSWKPVQNATLDATLFHSRIRNFIQKDSVTGISENHDRYRFAGLELLARLTPLEGLSVIPGYTYLRSRDESPGATSDQLQYRPEHKLSLDVRWQATRKLSLSGSALHVRDQVYFSRTGPDQTGTLDPYTVVNLRATYAVGAAGLRVYVGVDNIFDENYSTSYGFPQAGRTAYLGATIPL